MSPTARLFMTTILIVLVLFLAVLLLPFQVNMGHPFVLGLVAVVVALALWSLVTRIKKRGT